MINGSTMLPRNKFTKMFGVYLMIAVISIGTIENSVIRQEGEKAQSLYNSDDKVFVLTHENFYQSVFDQPYASNVEFYNSFCGFCRNFAPTYKAFAEDVYGWRDIVRVCAIDCADDANNDICRDMEIMRYPTLKYFPPFYRNESNHLGIEIQHAPMTVGEPHLLTLMANKTTSSSSWPNLQSVDVKSTTELFQSLPTNVDYVFLVYDPTNDSNVAQKVALDLSTVKEIQVRHVPEQIASLLGLNVKWVVYVGVKSTKSIEFVKHLEAFNRTTVRATIMDYLKTKGVHINLDKNIPSSSPRGLAPSTDVNEKDLVIIDYVKAHEGMVFQSDLEAAIRFSIFHELVKYNNLNDEQMAALKRYLAVLKRYSPLGDNGQHFLTELNDYVNTETKLFGKELNKKIKELERKHEPVFSSSRWIGCRPSMSGRRGFSCGLWQLFHYLTIQANNSEKSHDPLEVLQAIHGFVKHYFGCTHCSQHFQEMADKNNIWKVTTKEEAVLWLWSAHNEVNRRLAGDHTEDPTFPKIQYPSRTACPQCFQQKIPLQGITPAEDADQPHWDTSEVLYYLRRVYSLFNLSRYGVDDESILPEQLTSAYNSKLQSSISNAYSSAFSEMDVRMGILLYAVCMLIIVIAVKLFLQRGYRKKIYTHDFFGKV